MSWWIGVQGYCRNVKFNANLHDDCLKCQIYDNPQASFCVYSNLQILHQTLWNLIRVKAKITKNKLKTVWLNLISCFLYYTKINQHFIFCYYWAMIKSIGIGFLMVDALNIIHRSLLVVHIQILSGLPNKLSLQSPMPWR